MTKRRQKPAYGRVLFVARISTELATKALWVPISLQISRALVFLSPWLLRELWDLQSVPSLCRSFYFGLRSFPRKLTALQAEWQGVVRVREHIQKLVVPTFVFDMKHSAAFRNMLYNLPLVLAFDGLKQVLIQAREEGLFTGSSNM